MSVLLLKLTASQNDGRVTTYVTYKSRYSIFRVEDGNKT